MNNIYQKEIDNIFNLIANKHFKHTLVTKFFQQTDIIQILIKNAVKKCFIFKLGATIQPANFAIIFELIRILETSENTQIKIEALKNPKWNIFTELFFEPLKERLKEGLLPLSTQSKKNLGPECFDDYFDDFDSPKNSRRLSIKENPIKKLPFMELVNQVSDDFLSGKQTKEIHDEIFSLQTLKSIKEEENAYHICEDGLTLHDCIYMFTSEGSKAEKSDKYNSNSGNLFYDNNYWASNLIVDELELNELTKGIN
jgi:hypothetical protein